MISDMRYQVPDQLDLPLTDTREIPCEALDDIAQRFAGTINSEGTRVKFRLSDDLETETPRRASHDLNLKNVNDLLRYLRTFPVLRNHTLFQLHDGAEIPHSQFIYPTYAMDKIMDLMLAESYKDPFDVRHLKRPIILASAQVSMVSGPYYEERPRTSKYGDVKFQVTSDNMGARSLLNRASHGKLFYMRPTLRKSDKGYYELSGKIGMNQMADYTPRPINTDYALPNTWKRPTH